MVTRHRQLSADSAIVCWRCNATAADGDSDRPWRDAYQTGQVLYALHSGTTINSAAYQKGVRFLLNTQLEDGSWFVRSRAFAFQAYFETGFPHGTNQFISAAATSWAAIALAYVL